MSGNGHVIPSTPIAVDMWNTKLHPQARIFFLSHFHGDHICGLNSSWSYPIYASPITSKFLIHKLKIHSSLVRCLELGEDHLVPLDPDQQEMMTVTLLDANHCPGSVMFLFSGYFGDILYTGDFRYLPGMLDRVPSVDVLYLDNTYCSPKCSFPTRVDAVDALLSQIGTCLVQSERVFIGLDNLGKEDLLHRLVEERRCKVHVHTGRRDLMEILGIASQLTTQDKSHTKIFVLPTNQISGRNLARWNSECPTHAILATARFSGLPFRPFSKHPQIHVVPYSNHSSYLELKEFVRQVAPRSIVPIVGKQVKGIFGADISERADMSVFKQFLREPLQHDVIIPECVKKAMNEQESRHAAKLPTKRRKVARPLKRTPAVCAGVRFIVTEDSETDSDPEAVHFDRPDEVWEITHLTPAGHQTVYYSK